MKKIDIKSLLIGILLGTNLMFLFGAKTMDWPGVTAFKSSEVPVVSRGDLGMDSVRPFCVINQVSEAPTTGFLLFTTIIAKDRRS